MPSREHLFVSYAHENSSFAMWLARRLAAEGYAVWCDKLKLLGGQQWPKEINEAITDRSYLMLALLSSASIQKENPRGEWTLGIETGRRLGREFVIPLRVDKFDSQKLGFQHINRQYIDFSESWSDGLRKLLDDLRDYQAPKTFLEGKVISARSFLPEGLVGAKQEFLYPNALPATFHAKKVLRYQASRMLSDLEWHALKTSWVFHYEKNKRAYLALNAPPAAFSDVFKVEPVELEWEVVTKIYGIQQSNLRKEFIWKSARSLLVSGGATTDGDKEIHFREGALPGDWLHYTDLEGNKRRRGVAGTRTFRTGPETRQVVKYSLGFRLDTTEDSARGWLLLAKLYARVRSESGTELSNRSAFSRSRAIARDWWNDNQLEMHLGLLAFVANAQQKLTASGASLGVVFDTSPVALPVATGLNEALLEKTAVATEQEIDAAEEEEESE